MFSTPNKFKLRLLLILAGVLIQGFGTSWLIRLGMGSDPFTNFAVACDGYSPLSYGTTQALINAVMIIYVVVFNRQMIGYGTLANMVLLGYIIDFFDWIWDKVLPINLFDNRLLAWVILIPAFVCVIIGASVYMTAGLGASPYDGIPFILSEQLKKPFKYCRMVWDICFMVIGYLLGGGFGVVTIIIAFFAGTIINAIKKKMEIILQ